MKSQLKQSVTPTINCGESIPDMKLPAYPEFQDDIEKYSESQTEWAVEAAGAFKNNRLLRQRTKDCLDGMRQKGFIN